MSFQRKLESSRFLFSPGFQEPVQDLIHEPALAQARVEPGMTRALSSGQVARIVLKPEIGGGRTAS